MGEVVGRSGAEPVTDDYPAQRPWAFTGGTVRLVLVDRIVYSTITLMSVLIVYDGWQSLKVLGVVRVIVGPVLAMFLSHVFSAALARNVMLGRRLSRLEWRRVIRSESPFLLLAALPLVIVAVLHLSGYPSPTPSR